MVLLERLLRRRPRFGLLAIAGAAGVAVLVLLLSLVRAYWGEAPAPSTAIPMPPVAGAPDARPHPPPAVSAEAPAASPAPASDAASEEPPGPQGASATGASRAKVDPAPPEETAAVRLASRQALNALILQGQSRARPLASDARSPSPADGTPPRVHAPAAPSRQPPPSLPQPATGAAAPTTTAMSQVVGGASSAADRSAPPASEIRVFIHHVAGRGGDAALAQRLADHLRDQGYTVADIRPVDLSIGEPSVRYFFEDDRSASERLVHELGRFFEEAASRAPARASDFTHFAPKPRRGNVEVWLPAS